VIWKEFITGIGFLIAAYFIYKGIKGGPASEKTNWNGPTISLYVQGWGAMILCILAGIVMILKPLPSHV
jgi:hypothetical protein